MKHTLKKLPQSQVEFIITVEPEEYQKNLEKAAHRISEVTAIKGFRPGKAPFEMIKKEIGEMKLLQEALESIIQKTFFEAITAEKLETVGMPKIEVEKLAPGNNVVYKAVVALLPIVKLPDLTKIKVEKKVKPVDDKQLNETLDALRGMHAKEVIKTGSAEGTDKLVVDMDMLLDNVPIEGGQAKNYQVYLGEDHYIPGFNDQVKGMKDGDEREFSLDFPPTHYQKQIAGKNIKFKVKARGVYERQLPELNDEFAKTLGQDSADTLKTLVRGNLTHEAEHRADELVEIEILEKLIDESEIEEIPIVLVDSERQKMFHELKHDLERNGVTIEKYLEDIKKTEEQIYNDFKTQAEKRAKATLVSRAVAVENKITAEPAEINQEIELIRDAYKDNEDAIKNLSHPEVRDTIARTVVNKKVVAWLKEKVLGEKQHKCTHDHTHKEE
jgi:trigger factor